MSERRELWLDRIRNCAGIVMGILIIGGLIGYQLMIRAEMRQVEIAGLERLVVSASNNQVAAEESGKRGVESLTRNIYKEHSKDRLVGARSLLPKQNESKRESLSQRSRITTIIEHHRTIDGDYCSIGISASAKEAVTYDSVSKKLWATDGACSGVDIDSRVHILWQQINGKS